MKKILFLCTGNSCRSQMAEGWVRHIFGDAMDVFSAGTAPHGVDPRAVKVMSEAGVDISVHTSNHVDEYADIPFDLVITVCDSARESCPVFPGKGKKVHHSFDDPPFIARRARNEEEVLTPYRRVRDEIRDFVIRMISLL
jgi:arsenate reductase